MTRIGAIGLASVLVFCLSGCFRPRPTPITQEELVRRTQEIMDATAPGNPDPWKKYFADDAIYFDEKGRFMDKAALLKDVAPLPAGFSGSIKVVNGTSRILRTTAILSYDLDESETIFGQEMTARYHGTDTWVFRNGQWQIIAGQMLRYYEDPAAGTANAKEYKAYTGTYELTPGTTRQVTAAGDQLSMQRAGTRASRGAEILLPEACDVFFRKGVEGRIVFRRDTKGKVIALIDRRNNEDVVWKRVS